MYERYRITKHNETENTPDQLFIEQKHHFCQLWHVLFDLFQSFVNMVFVAVLGENVLQNDHILFNRLNVRIVKRRFIAYVEQFFSFSTEKSPEDADVDVS